MDKKKEWLHPLRVAAIAGSCLCAPAQTATAAALRLAPVRVEVAPHKQFCSLSLSNDGAEPTIVQIRGYGWSKDKDGKDVLDQANGPAVNPSIVQIPTGQTRLIRCSLPDHVGAVEESYRLLIDELPGVNPAPGTVKTLLRISIPVFRAPTAAAPAIAWSMGTAGDGTARLLMANNGNRHAQISAVILHPLSSRTAPVRLAQGFYLLAGGHTSLPLPPLPEGGIRAVELETAEGPLSASRLAPGKDGD